jgi:hypothetical protein
MSTAIISFNPLIADYFAKSELDPDMKVLVYLLALSGLQDDFEIDPEIISNESKIDIQVLNNGLMQLAQSGAITINFITEEESLPCINGLNSIANNSPLPASQDVPSSAISPLPPQCEITTESNVPINNLPDPSQSADERPSGLSMN